MRWALRSKIEHRETRPHRACTHMGASCVAEREHCGQRQCAARAPRSVRPPQLAAFRRRPNLILFLHRTVLGAGRMPSWAVGPGGACSNSGAHWGHAASNRCVVKRMLSMPHQPHKPLGKKKPKKSRRKVR
jgi:hypothetical protein